MDLYNASLGMEEPETIELTMEQYEDGKIHLQSIIDCADAAKRLASNPDFASLVMEGYLKNEPLRLAELMASGRLNQSVFDNCAADIKAVANFRNYLKNITEQGAMASDEMAALEEARDEAIKAEEAMNANS